SGKALNKFKELIKAQGGNPDFIDNNERFKKAKYIVPVISEDMGIVKRINAENIGIVAMELGAGRATKESIIDLSVGIVLNKKRGDKVKLGDVLAYIHSNDKEKIEKATKDIIRNYEIVSKYDDNIPLIYEIVK
ncbi:MAG: pyrimidine-nucleoside phosphorylase, partial [Cetobacterium sp.]